MYVFIIYYVLLRRRKMEYRKRSKTVKGLLIAIPVFFILAINIDFSVPATKRVWNAIGVTAKKENGQVETNTEFKINFFTVIGLYNSGTNAMWETLRENEEVAARKGVKLRTYGTRDGAGGYPPCGLDLNANGNVTKQGTIGKISSGVEWLNHWDSDSNLKHIYDIYADDRFYTIWKHTPPHHPLITCFRPDTLYVIMVRHPKTWTQSTSKKPYDLSYSKEKNVWTLDRTKNVVRMPPLLANFQTLEHMWAYYMKGYLSWNSRIFKRNFTGEGQSNLSLRSQTQTTLNNDEPKNIVLVPYELYLRNPKKVIAELYSIASGGILDNESYQDYHIPGAEKCQDQADKLDEMIKSEFFRFSTDETNIPDDFEQTCRRLGYSCDTTANLFASET